MTTLPILFHPVRAGLAGGWRALPVAAVVLLLCVPIGPDRQPPRLSVADGASAVLVAVCVVVLLRDRRRLLSRAGAAVLAAPAIGFAVATAASQDPVASLNGFVRYAQVFVLVPAATALLLRSRRDFRWVAGAVVAAALAQGALGVYQYVSGTGASYAGQRIRAVGTFGPVDVMGMATVVACGAVLALAMGLGAPARAPRWLRPVAVACAGLLLVPLVFSFSRGSWLSMAVAAAVVLLLVGLRTAMTALAVFLAALVVLVGGAGVGSALISERLSSITQVTDAPDRSVTDRYALWAAAASIWRDEPVTGVGIKGFPAHRDGHASLGLSSGSDTEGAGQEFRREPLLSPHNMYLLVLSEQGLVGITAVVGSWSALVVLGLRRLRRARRAGWPVDCGLAAMGLLAYLFADFLYGDIGGPSTVLTGVMFGLAAWWALSPAALAPSDAGARRVGPVAGDGRSARDGRAAGDGRAVRAAQAPAVPPAPPAAAGARAVRPAATVKTTPAMKTAPTAGRAAVRPDDGADSR
ncbi:O-antigen ligase family protein [Streptomyces sp. 7N604]|uniref:O-antigen ligase family protein n=1 Tax=Streptomyces sp. 7N604 TaxID=3457415 RepID=UPI003FD4524A